MRADRAALRALPLLAALAAAHRERLSGESARLATLSVRRLAAARSAAAFATAKAKSNAAPAEDSDFIPPVLHFVVEHCTEEELSSIRTYASEAAGLQVLCHDAPARTAYVREKLPQYAQFYEALPKPVMKADVFRLMVLHNEGGFYADDDVEFFPGFRGFLAGNATPGQSFLQAGLHRHANLTGMIVGWERRTGGQPVGAWCDDFGGMLCNSLATWAIAAPKGHPYLQDVVHTIQEYFASPEAAAHTSDADVLRHTGPVIFSTRVLMHMNPDSVLGIEKFGCGQAHSNSPPCSKDDLSILLQHHFRGSWRR